MYFCIYLLYVFFSNLELCLSCSSRTAIDVFECRARSCYCLSLNKRFVVVVVAICTLHAMNRSDMETSKMDDAE